MVWPEGIAILMEKAQVPASGRRAESLPGESSHPHGDVSARCSHSKLQRSQFTTRVCTSHISRAPEREGSGALRAGREGKESGLNGDPG